MSTQGLWQVFFGTVVLAACETSDSTSLAPVADASFAKGGGFNTPNSYATLTGAITTPSAQTVAAGGGSETLIVQAAPQWTFQSQLHYPNRVSAGLTGCTTDPANAPAARVAALFTKLTDGLRARQLWASVDLTNLGGPSSDNSLSVHWSTPDSLFTVTMNTISALPGSVTVTQTGPNEYTFTGGSLAIRDRSGQVKNHLHIRCPNIDTAVLTQPATP